MELKRTIEAYSGKEKYQTDHDSNYFWKILFLLVLVALILIVLFTFCYRYVFGKIISSCKRCLTRRNKKSNIDDNLFIMEETGSDTNTKRRFLWPDTCNISTFCGNKYCKLKTLLPEKKKLLASRGNKSMTSSSNSSNNNVALTKRLSLKMSFSSFSSHVTKSKGVHSQALNKWDIKDLENYECNEFNTRNIKHFTGNSRKIDKDICFSDTDLRFLVIPISSKKSNVIKHDGKVELCKWNSADINDYYDERNTNSKLIEFKFHNTDSYSDNTETYGVSNSKSNCSHRSFVSKNLASDSKYLSDSAANRFDNLPNIYLTKLQRSTNSSACSTIPNISSINEINSEYPPADTSNIKTDRRVSHIKFENNNSEYFATGKNNVTGIVKMNDIKSKIRLDGYTAQLEKMKGTKSSMDIRLNHLKGNWSSLEDQLENSRRKSKSDENFTYKNGMRNDNTKYFISRDVPLEPEKIVYNKQGVHESTTFNSEANEICDELGILFSQYIKLEAQQCLRKYCPISRRLKQRARHSIKKCQTKSNYHQIYPHDQRPACNSGNVCADTYDELKLMRTSPLERKNIYRCMFDRRKQFLNQPCTLSNQNLAGSIQ